MKTRRMNTRFVWPRAGRCAMLLASGLAACTPTYDWRETKAPGAAVVAMFPCRPDRFSRPVQLAGARVQMLLLSCSAGDTTFALSHPLV